MMAGGRGGRGANFRQPVIQGSAIQGPEADLVPKPDEPTSFHEPYPGRYGHYAGLPLPPEYVDLGY